jgi:hypothetical protein
MIERVNPDSGDTALVVRMHEARDVGLGDVSPDGRSVAYLVDDRDGPLGIRVVDWNGKNDRPLGWCFGTARADRIVGSPLPDRIAAGSDDDVVDVRGGGADVVRCGAGRDVVYADRSDSVARDCERVVRRAP